MNISTDLYNKLVARFPSLSMGTQSAESTANPEEARLFTFEYVEQQQELGTVTVSLLAPGALEIIYSRGITDAVEDTHSWFDFLQSMRRFSVRNALDFQVQDITKPALNQQDLESRSQRDTPPVVGEGRMWGSSRTSYQRLPAVKLIVRHSHSVDETVRGARSRRISKIFAETSAGERFLLPTQRLTLARALGQHISAGGRPWDDLAEQIVTCAGQPALKKLYAGAKTPRGYQRLVDTLNNPEEQHMDLQLREDAAQDQLTVNAHYENMSDLVEAVMAVLAERSNNPLVSRFATTYTSDQLAEAAALATQYLRYVRESQLPAQEDITESDDRTVSALRQLAMDMGELDRSDINMVADMIADNTDEMLIRQYILDLDTAPREAILNTINSFEPGMLKALFPKDHEEKYFAVMREAVSRSVKLSNIRWKAEPGMDIPASMTIDVDIPSDADEDDVFEIIAATLEDEVGYSVSDFDFQLAEGYRILPNYDSERYGNREGEGLEGPMRARNGKVVYYDKAEGLYYDPDRDMFISNDEWDLMNREHVPYGDIGANENVSAPQSAAHRRAQLPKKIKLKGFGPDGAKGNMSNPSARAALKPGMDEEKLDERSKFEQYKNLLIIYDPKTMEVVKTYPHTNASAARKDSIQSKLPIVHGADFMELMVSKYGMTNALAKAKDMLPVAENSELAEAVTSAVAFPGYFDMAETERDKIIAVYKQYRGEISSSIEKQNGELVVVVDGPVNVMRKTERALADAGVKFMKTESLEEAEVDESIQYMYSLKDKGMSIEEIAKELGMKPEEVRDAMSKTEESVTEDEDTRKIASNDGVDIFAYDSDDEGSAIDVHRDGEVVATGYYDMFAGDFVIDGKSYGKIEDVVNDYKIAAMSESELAEILSLAGIIK